MTSAWAGRLFFGTSDMLYAGPVGPTRPHSHHAFQLVVVERGTMTLGGANEIVTDVAIVPSDAEHAIAVGSMSASMMYVDPDSIEGRRLRMLEVPRDDPSAWREAAAPLRALTGTSTPRDWAAAEQFRRELIDALVGPTVRPIPQHPALLRIVRALPDRLGAPLRIDPLAAELGLSASRLAHLFAEQLGLPFRSYVRWLRIRRAAAAVQAGRTLTEAAHEAGFADSSHLSRAFARAFGIAPSDVTGLVEWMIGPSPF
jgi:AraC-like DNA-binding protein